MSRNLQLFERSFTLSFHCFRYVFPADVLRRISSRITNEVAGINRVTYDISSKPPAVRPYLFIDALAPTDYFLRFY